MKESVYIPAKRIIATEPQALINLKLRYNALIEKVNTNERIHSQLEQLHAQIEQLTLQNNSHS